MKIGRAVGATLGGIVISAMFASPASAGCGDPGTRGHAGLFPAVYRTGSGFEFTTVRANDDDRPSIVGLWQFSFISDGNNVAPFFIPDGAPLDAGYAQWHSDGTEIMNSSRDPVTSSFCLGTWAATGRQTYRLNHFALTWDNTGKLCTPEAGASNCLVGSANIREEVTLDRHGDTYTGWVTIDQYDTNQKLIFHLAGKVRARRINP